ncbi:MAG: CopG family transcriptional regulator [Steroidobacteraceae bacterium]
MTTLTLEDRSARLTILIDPRKKALFERLCAEEDATPSQVVRRMIRQYILERTGKPWVPSADEPPSTAPKRAPSHGARRGGRS